MGRIDIKPGGNLGETVVTEDGWLRFGVGNFDGQAFAAKATIDGGMTPVQAHVQATVNGGTPVTANVNLGTEVGAHVEIGNRDQTPFAAVVSGPNGKPIDASVRADAIVTANVGGTGAPIRLDPIKLDVGQLRLKPDLEIKFRLFGIPIFSIRIKGNADFGPQS